MHLHVIFLQTLMNVLLSTLMIATLMLHVLILMEVISVTVALGLLVME